MLGLMLRITGQQITITQLFRIMRYGWGAELHVEEQRRAQGSVPPVPTPSAALSGTEPESRDAEPDQGSAHCGCCNSVSSFRTRVLLVSQQGLCNPPPLQVQSR